MVINVMELCDYIRYSMNKCGECGWMDVEAEEVLRLSLQKENIYIL